MIDDEIDRIAGNKKKTIPASGPTRPRWPSAITIVTLMATATLTWFLARLIYAPSSLDLRDLEACRAVPNFRVQVEETLGANEGEMVLTIDLSNLGPGDHPAFAAIRPLQDWVSFGPQTSAKVTPPQPFDARIGAGHATVSLRDPVKAGTHARITLDGIKLDDRPFYRESSQAISLNVYAGRIDQRIRPHRELPPRKPNPSPPAATPKPNARGRR